MFNRLSSCDRLDILFAALAAIIKATVEKIDEKETEWKYDPIPEVKDLSALEVNQLIQWAEQKQYTPGIVHGARRKAAGIEMIRRAILVLKGHEPSADDMPEKLTSLSL